VVDRLELDVHVPYMRLYAAEHAGEELSPEEVESYRQGTEHFATAYEQLTGRRPIPGRQTSDGLSTTGH
jgi:hypothetical protein